MLCVACWDRVLTAKQDWPDIWGLVGKAVCSINPHTNTHSNGGIMSHLELMSVANGMELDPEISPAHR